MAILEKNDLLICKNLNGSIDENTVFARITQIDRISDIVYLDRYTNFGRFHYDTKHNAKMCLSILENQNSFYQKMTDKEILIFCRGLEHISNNFQTNIEYQYTLDMVEKLITKFYN